MHTVDISMHYLLYVHAIGNLDNINQYVVLIHA